MNREQLEWKLTDLGVSPNSYSLGKIKGSDCVCVVEEDRKWKVYYVERDKPDELGVFDTVDDAYAFVYETFQKWLG